ncbi:DUF2637 domain-containing protein [Saccharopolyspora pogona]|uniref:DUF2637 domain-containing protein n=1 Tax=Saccharopolyspora pogona TaxID=333966 RepID=UPI00168632D7|nr:DUF2637 domain-containing protein [Saccharopolyspora pogona]
MMPQGNRRRVIGGILATLAVALIPAAMFWPAPDQDPAPAETALGKAGTSITDVTSTAVHLAAGLVAVAVAVAIAVIVIGAAPGVQHAVRIARAWRAGRSARKEGDAQASGSGAPAARPTLKRVARVIVLVMAVVVSAVAAFALALNFDHGRALAELNGEHGWRAHIWPLTVDGLLISASLVGLVRRLLGLSVGFRSHLAFAIGIAASAGANIVLALHEPATGWDLAENIGVKTLPTLVLLLTHERGLALIAYYAEITDAFGTQGANPQIVAAVEAKARAEAELHEMRVAVERRLAEVQAQAAAAVQQAHDELAENRKQNAALLQRAHADTQQQVEVLQQRQAAELRTEREQNKRTQELLDNAQRVVGQLRSENRETAQQLAELDQTIEQDGERNPGDFDRLRVMAMQLVADRRAEGVSDSLTGEVARILRVSPRWVQLHVPEATGGGRTRQLQFA